MAEQILPVRPDVRLNDAFRSPAPGGTALVVQSGTLTPAPIFAEEACATPLANPVVADGVGVFAPMWTNVPYPVDVYLSDANGIGVDTIIAAPRFGPTSTAATGIAVSPSDGVPETNVQAALAGLGERALEDREATRPVETGGTGGRTQAEAQAALGIPEMIAGGLALTALAAPPGGAINVALSNGSAAANGFGSAGAGLYVKTGSTWARV